MIIELFTYLTAPCKKTFKKIGFLEAAIGLGARHKRCRKAWEPHLRNSRDVILSSMSFVEKDTMAVVLGSGLLLDIPLKEIASKFNQIYLVDVVHLPVVRKTVKNFPNVSLIEADISGKLASLIGSDEDLSLDKGIIEDADFVISANILSQLSHYPLEYFEKKGIQTPQGFAHDVTHEHLDTLGTLSAKVCLITETKRTYFQQDGEQQFENPLHGITLPPPDKTWEWELAPPPEFKRNIGIRLDVASFIDFQGTFTTQIRRR